MMSDRSAVDSPAPGESPGCFDAAVGVARALHDLKRGLAGRRRFIYLEEK